METGGAFDCGFASLARSKILAQDDRGVATDSMWALSGLSRDLADGLMVRLKSHPSRS